MSFIIDRCKIKADVKGCTGVYLWPKICRKTCNPFACYNQLE